MGSPTTWLLNFESDEELAIGGLFTASAGFARHLTALRKRHARHLLREGDCELGPQSRGMQAQAWCPTPGALLRIKALGAIPPPAPDVEILRLVNGREFCARLPENLPDAFFARDPRELTRGLGAGRPPNGWLFKRNFGTAGRGQMRIGSNAPSAAQERWIDSSWRNGGLRVEPFVSIEQEFTFHGWITAQGEWSLGQACVQTCEPQGAWLETHLAGPEDLSAPERAALEASAELCAQAMGHAGYFGPFGIDAFRWRDEAGRTHFQPRSEINARYTLGWHVGYGERPAG